MSNGKGQGRRGRLALGETVLDIAAVMPNKAEEDNFKNTWWCNALCLSQGGAFLQVKFSGLVFIVISQSSPNVSFQQIPQ